jgi:hypothetical protein
VALPEPFGKHPKVESFVISGANHFNVLGPTNGLFAEKALTYTGSRCELSFATEEVDRAFAK